LQDSDPNPLVIGGSGSVPKSHGFTTLRTTTVSSVLLLVNVKYVQSYETTSFHPKINAPFYTSFSDPVSDPCSNPDPKR
jgi:hypothetical protein